MTGRTMQGLVTTQGNQSHHTPVHVFLRCWRREIYRWRESGSGAGLGSLCWSLLLHQEKRNTSRQQDDGEDEETKSMHWTLLSTEIEIKEDEGEETIELLFRT